TLAAIRESQNRITAMALVHERMYRSEEISSISFMDYVDFLVNSHFVFYGVKARRISYTISMEDLPIDIDTAIPLGLIMTELVSNSLKYAFPEGRGGEIRITGSTEDDGTFRFTVSDNGVGIPETIDWRNTDSLGLRLVNSLVTQLNGTIDLDRTGGTSFTFIVHPKEER
ncbi:MAG: sensor histidine kinase, partial [Methanoregulaceae archaeon]|nr:sensor histidine kinase [Methanoregulaceae archaeon]